MDELDRVAQFMTDSDRDQMALSVDQFRLLADALQWEREQCAKVAERELEKCNDALVPHIPNRIRERGEY